MSDDKATDDRLDLDAIEARAKAADVWPGEDAESYAGAFDGMTVADASLLVHARSDVPALVARVRELIHDAAIAKGATVDAFIAGAAWWEFDRTGATMWAADKARALEAAEKRYPFAPRVEIAEMKAERDAARAENAKLRNLVAEAAPEIEHDYRCRKHPAGRQAQVPPRCLRCALDAALGTDHA